MLAHPAICGSSILISTRPGRYGTKMSPRNHSVALAEPQHHVINPTNPRGALDDGVEHRLHVRRRAADDAEHLGRCRLMLQASRNSALRSWSLLEQSHVLDGDYRLIGEGFKQLDLLLGEWTDLCSANYDRADGTPSRSNGVASIVRTPKRSGSSADSGTPFRPPLHKS